MQELLKIIDHLRDPQHGCPWDLKQTHQSLIKNLLEESYEYIDAANSANYSNMQEELGDLLLQVLLNSKIAQDEKHFSFQDVVNSLKNKLISRHEHVFGPHQVKTAQEALASWARSKAKEGKVRKNIDEHLLYNPPLLSAENIGQASSLVHFDWDNASQVLDVVQSEWEELKEALAQQKIEAIEEEIGDLLFSIVQLARKLQLSAYQALIKSNTKFIKRFQQMEKIIAHDHKQLSSLSLPELDLYWQKAKDEIKKG